MLSIGWTTVSSLGDAESIAQSLIDADAAVCVQIEGPIGSVYRWEGKREQSTEYRLTIKFLTEKQTAVESTLWSVHPYDVPEWIVVEATTVGEKYLSWARSGLQSDRF